MDLEASAPVADQSLADATREARAGAAAMLNGTESAPNDEASGAPAEPPPPPQEATPAPAAPAPPAAPVSAAPTTIDITNLDAEARRFLEMHGGDPNKALAKALADNNRLAELHRAGAPTQPAAQPDQPQPTDTPAPPVYTPEQVAQQIEQNVVQFTRTDPECRKLDAQFVQNEDRLGKISASLDATMAKLNREQLRAELEEIAGDPLRARDVADEIVRLDTERIRLETEKDLLYGRQERLKASWTRLEARARGSYNAHAQQWLQEQQAQVEYEQKVGNAASALETAWDPTMSKAMTDHKIPDSERADFNEECINAALAQLERGMVVSEVGAFIDKQAAKFAARIDRLHRAQSADYGRLAHERAALGAAPGPVPAAATSQETEEPKDLNDLYKTTRKELFAEARGR